MRYGLLTFDEPVADTSRKILHVDMDAFYASVEIRDNPSLKGKPVVIAKHPNQTGGRGIVSTCSYEARKYGIHSAMSSMEAYKRCPQAVFIAGNHDHYREVSRQIHQILHRYTDLVEGVSLDEAYLDVTNNKLGIKSGTLIGQDIQRAIYQELQLTCSVGVSYNKFLAKLASDYLKPHGMTVITPEGTQDFLDQLPIEDFHGVGTKSIEAFHELGINTGWDLRQLELDELIHQFGKMGYSLYFKVRGIHNAPVTPERDRKSVGTERTYLTFLETDTDVTASLKQIHNKLMDRLQVSGLDQAGTLTLKIRYDDFTTITRQTAGYYSLDNPEDIYQEAVALWTTHGEPGRPVRLLGLTLSNFADPAEQAFQLNLLTNEQDGPEKAKLD